MYSKKKYNFDITKYKELEKLLKEKKLKEEKEYIKINPDYIYIENDILVDLIDEDYISQMEV